MRVALLTNLTARASLPVLERLALSPQVELRHIFFFNTLAASRAAPLQVLREFGLTTLASKMAQVMRSQLRVHLGRRLKAGWIKPDSSYEFAVFHQLPHTVTGNMNSTQSYEQLLQADVDVVVVCVCKNILRAKLLSMPSLHFVNIHPSLLPYYRGPSPTFWMLYNGEQQTGYTIHRMTTQVDRGAILAQAAMPLDCQRTELEIELEVFTAAADTLVDTLLKLKETSPDSSPSPDQAEGSYHTYPTPQQRQELAQRLAAISTSQ